MDLSLKRCNTSKVAQNLEDSQNPSLKRCNTLVEDVQVPSFKRSKTSGDGDDISRINCCLPQKHHLTDSVVSIPSDSHYYAAPISSLPDELLARILSFLPSKDAVCTTLLLRRIMSRVFDLITNIDLDDSTITHCLVTPHLIERFTLFKSFVTLVLQATRYDHLRRFRLVIGGDKALIKSFSQYHQCIGGCLPDVEPALLNAWLSFPLARIGLRELDLCIHVRTPGTLPPAVFACQTLEILKLHMNIDVVPDSPFCLPNLKVLHLASFIILEDDFITRLVSSCPVLEDLSIDWCCWDHADFITISSPSLLSLFLNIRKRDDHFVVTNIDVVTIDTPRLRYLRYCDDLARQYRVTQMNDLVKADIHIKYELQDGEDFLEASFRSMLSLLRPVCNVQHLSLTGASLEVIELGDLTDDEMPVFHNLKYLVLGYATCRWDKVLVGILNYTPRLETLEFPEGVARVPERELEELERECWRRAQAIPSCYRLHLKQVFIHDYVGVERELEWIRFILRNAPVLEKLVVRRKLVKRRVRQKSVEKTLRELPKASTTCLIQVE